MSTLHAVDVTRLLQGLVGKKALLQEGQGRWSRYRLAEAVDSEHSHTLLAIAAPARNQKRLQPNEMERLVLELCRGCWLTRNELAELLGRHPDGLRQRFLNPMVGHGMLRLRYPDKPNRADQAYTSSDAGKENEIS